MSQTSPAQDASNAAYQTALGTAQKGFGIGIPALQGQIGDINSGLAAGGEPGYVKSAYTGQRTGLVEAMSSQDRSSSAAGAARSKSATLGGNAGAGIVPSDYGARLARSLSGSRTNEAMGQLEETMNLTQMGLGGTGEAGSAAMSAGMSSERAISMMQQYNPTTAALFGLGSLGGGIYGALSDSGAFSGVPNSGGGSPYTYQIVGTTPYPGAGGP